jgi:hypothetical protein
MMRPGARALGPPLSLAELLLSAFHNTARRLALSAGAWRARLLRLWRWVADELTDDPRHPRVGKRKSKNKSAAHHPKTGGF